jgi:transcriptional regulator GlxA family with amidase domain
MQLRLSEVTQTDIVIIPSLYLLDPVWPDDPYPDLTRWLQQMHHQNTLLCSACTGAMLLAETGLLDGYEATQHWAFEALFRQKFPNIRLNISKVLITTGESERIVMSGASAAWHDLLIYLISRYVGPRAAQIITKYFLLSPHSEGQAPYVIFQEHLTHGDNVILRAQQWLKQHSTQPHPIEEMQQKSRLPARTFSRRFNSATGHSPVQYLQRLRIEQAKKYLESSDTSVDEISWQVGYEDPAFFRRLFKRLTGMTPKDYRRKFHWEGLAKD